MKNKSFFHFTVFKHDLSRFRPLWIIYLIIGLMSNLPNLIYAYHANAQNYLNSLDGMGPYMCIFALVTTQLLFGDLYQGRLCNAIHALPVRREGLFFSHYAAGLAMGIVPNLLIALVGMLSMGKFWFVALLWWLATSLIYLLFFHIGLFSIQCAGTRFASIAIYALINLLSMLIMWYFEALYLPLIYGMEMTESIREYFYWFSPLVHIANGHDWVFLEHAQDCVACLNISDELDYMSYTNPNCNYLFCGFDPVWWYLGIVTLVGFGFGAAALALYRKRHLECAGDFVSFKPMGTVFTLLASAACGVLLYFVLFDIAYIALFVGLLIGFFLCRMLLERSTKVFRKANFLQAGAFMLVIALTLGMTALDVAGVERRIPKTEDVQSVTIADRYLSDWTLEDVESGIPGAATLTDPADIQVIREIHQLLLEEGNPLSEYDDYASSVLYDEIVTTDSLLYVTIHYVLKNGHTVTRYYYTLKDSPAMQRLAAYTTTPHYYFGFDTAEEMAQALIKASGYEDEFNFLITDQEGLARLAEALFADVASGSISTTAHMDTLYPLHLNYESEDGTTDYAHVYITKDATHTLQVIKDYSFE